MQQADSDTTFVMRTQEALAEAVERATDVYALLADPAFWYTISATALRVALIVGIALAVLNTVRKAVRRWEKHVADRPAIDPRKQRVLTVGNLITSVSAYLVWAIVGIMVLSALGVDVTPLLAGAGVAGLAIGFGAQQLVRDVISGMFLLFDDIIHVGDLITFNGQAGMVESISIRVIKVRKFDGELVMIPAGELRTFGNRSMGFARIIVEVGVSYEQDTDTVLRALERVAEEWAEREENRAVMLQEKPEVQALMALGDSAVMARIVVQVIPGEQFRGERDLRLLIKQRFDEWGIEIPFPRRTVYVRHEPETPAHRPTVPPRPPGQEHADDRGAD